MAVVLTLVQTKQIRINIHKRNNTKIRYKQYNAIQYNTILHNNLGGSIYHLFLFFEVRPANEPTITDVPLCSQKVGHSVLPLTRLGRGVDDRGSVPMRGKLFFPAVDQLKDRPGVHRRSFFEGKSSAA